MNMKNGTSCPKCHGERILHAPSIADRDRHTVHPLALEVEGLFFHSPVGELEAYVCASCGFTEIYVRDVKALLKHVKG